MEITDQPRTCTDAPQATVLPVLRSVALPPRPAPPERPLTASPALWPSDAEVDRALGAYGDPYDRPSAWAAFGDDLPRGAA